MPDNGFDKSCLMFASISLGTGFEQKSLPPTMDLDQWFEIKAKGFFSQSRGVFTPERIVWLLMKHQSNLIPDNSSVDNTDADQNGFHRSELAVKA